jgi:hypothetical protein
MGEVPIPICWFIIRTLEVKWSRKDVRARWRRTAPFARGLDPFTGIRQHVNNQPLNDQSETFDAPRRFLFVAIRLA